MTRTIVVTVGLDGKATVEANGFTGPACEKATAELLKALGGEQDEKRKPEYHTKVVVQQTTGG